MEKREKIIVIIATAAVIYGTLDYFVLSKREVTSSLTTTTNDSEILSTLTTQLSSQAVGSQVLDMIKRIKTPWPEKVFFDSPVGTILAEEDKQTERNDALEQFDPNNFKYTGYLEMGGNKIAIINGSDYTIGESVNNGILSNISATAIEVTMQAETFEVEIKPDNDAN